MATDDMELLREYAARHSEQAFETLVSRYAGLVYSAALRQVENPQLAEEITQAVFIILARKADKLSQQTVLSGWLYRAACYTAGSARKQERRRQQREQEAYMESTLQAAETDAAWKQIGPLLEEAMMRLCQADRDALVLRFFEGRSLNEVGQALGGSEDATKKRVSRALEKLRKFFTKRGVRSTAEIIAGAISANSVQTAPALLAKSVTAVAFAKGATASVSTLTLIKGALKIMAWTKAKTTAVVGITSAVLILGIGVGYFGFFYQTHLEQTRSSKLPVGNVAPMVSKGSGYAVVLASDGSLWSWGEEPNGSPVLGLANIKNTVSLCRIGNESDWKYVASSEYHSLAIKSDGTLWAWGGNFSYQLGDGTKVNRTTPVPSVPGNDWKQAAVGGQSSFALKDDGTLWAWGGAYLGTGDDKGRTNAVQIGTSANWVKIWASDIQTVGLQSDGTLWFWGSPDGNGRGTNNFLVPTRISPDTNWTDVCFGYFTVFAIKSDGTLWSWGNEANFYTGASVASMNVTPMQVGTESDWQSCAFSSSEGFYQLLRKTDGSLWALDASDHRTVKPSSEYKPIKSQKLDLPKNIVALAAGGDNIGVILTRDGEVWTWGNVFGSHPPNAFWGPNHNYTHPIYKVIDKPWQLSVIDATK
jgi:RNA polymerase sigma factor (sigma-70 family)